MKRKGLGRGLEALLGANAAEPHESAPSALPLGEIIPGRFQPRRDFDPTHLAELADSIRAQGVLQPILVRPLPTPTGLGACYEIIAGERRFRAAGLAGLQAIPAIIRDVDDQTALAMALIENLQRHDLNALEEAMGIQRLLDEFGMTHEEAAAAVGRSRSTTSNLLRLLSLPLFLQEALREGAIEAGHARALVGLSEPLQRLLLEKIRDEQLSVRQVEAAVRQAGEGVARALEKPQSKNPSPALPADWRQMQETLADHLGLETRLKMRGKGGEITIKFNSIDEFEGLRTRLFSPTE